MKEPGEQRNPARRCKAEAKGGHQRRVAHNGGVRRHGECSCGDGADCIEADHCAHHQPAESWRDAPCLLQHRLQGVRQCVEGNGDSIVDHKIGHRRRNHWHDEDIDQKVRQADHRGAVELRKRLYFFAKGGDRTV